MRKLIFIGAALAASAAFAQTQTEDETRTAALDTSSAAFTKLDADGDGRVSAIEAANDTKLAAAFTQADKDRDGYLSKEEFQMAGEQSSESESGQMPRSPQSTTPDTTSPE